MAVRFPVGLPAAVRRDPLPPSATSLPAALKKAFTNSAEGKLLLQELQQPSLAFSNVKEFKVAGKPRINADLVLSGRLPKGGDLVARMSTHYGKSAGQPKMDQVPLVSSVEVPKSGLEAGAELFAKLARVRYLDALGTDPNQALDPKKVTVTVRKTNGGSASDPLAEVTFTVPGFAGQGSTFHEGYQIYGRRTSNGYELTRYSYDNWLEDANGQQIE